MANRRLSMRKIKEVLRLKYEKGFPAVRLQRAVTEPLAGATINTFTFGTSFLFKTIESLLTSQDISG